MKEPTKADLATAVAKLTGENVGMRDLLAAISLAADTVPVARGAGYVDEWKRSTHVLAVIKNAAALSDWDGHLAWAVREVRALAAEPVGYEVYVRPEDDELHAEPEQAEHPFDAGEGSGELSGPGRELLRQAIADEDAASVNA